MDFLSEIFSALGSKESLQALLWLVIAGFIGFFTAWFYWRREYDQISIKYDAAEREAAELRIRNTELSMTTEEIRKEIAENNLKMMDLEVANRKLMEEKGQMYADLMAARGELETKGKKGSKKENPEEHVTKSDIKFENMEAVAKATSILSGNEPIIDVAHSALDSKTKSDLQKDSADFIRNILGSRIKRVSAKQKDNLQLIKGVGPFIEGKLNGLGIYSFEQIGQLDTELIDKLTEAIQFFPGRIERDDWVGQSKQLME